MVRAIIPRALLAFELLQNNHCTLNKKCNILLVAFSQVVPKQTLVERSFDGQLYQEYSHQK